MNTEQINKTRKRFRRIMTVDIIIASILFGLSVTSAYMCVTSTQRNYDNVLVFQKVEKIETVSAEELEKPEPIQIIEPEPEPILPATNNEINLLALVTMAEAEGESELGKRLVIDTILNRVDNPRFTGNTIHEVVYARNQFEAMWNGRINKCYVKDDIRQLVIEELQSRTNNEVVFFRTGRYSSDGVPLFKEGNHYFSKIK